MKRFFVLAILLISSVGARGHHSFSAEFDSEKFVTVTGTVSEVRFRNPHVQYFIDVDAEGEVSPWIIAAHSMIVMRRNNVSTDTVSVADQITASGYAGRDGAQKVYLETLDAADGTRYEMYGEAVRRAGNVTSPLCSMNLSDIGHSMSTKKCRALRCISSLNKTARI